ncbi:MAG: hypothetical protein ACI81L_002589 [Verrucomicrobiales bacterium]|jgi:hypothetical protein
MSDHYHGKLIIRSGSSALAKTPITETRDDVRHVISGALDRAEKSLAGPFTGVTIGGASAEKLFPLGRTGVSVQSMIDAVEGFLASLPGAEESAGLELMQSLEASGLDFLALSQAQQDLLVELISLYTGRLGPGHAEVKLNDVTKSCWRNQVRADGRLWRRRCLLLPNYEPADADRVRSPARDQLRQQRAKSTTRAHGRTHAKPATTTGATFFSSTTANTITEPSRGTL